MRAVVLTKHGPPRVLKVQEREEPTARPGQVIVDVAAAGVNFADVMARVGLYPDAPKPPCVIGYEVAGTIAAVGAGVQHFKPGDRVMAGTRFGGYAERIAIDAGNAIPLHAGLSFSEGAALPVNAATAWTGLVRYGALQPGERVLIHAAAGGVGIMATQIARAIGAEVHGTASPSKHDAIRGFGVDHTHDYTQSGWERGLPRFDLIMDAVGGKSFRTSYDLLAPGGRLVAFGASSVMSGERRNLLTAARSVLQMPKFNVMKQMQVSKTVIGLNLLTLWDYAGTLEPWIAPLQALVEDGTLRPQVAAELPFDRAGDAHLLLSERRNIGKVVLTPETV